MEVELKARLGDFEATRAALEAAGAAFVKETEKRDLYYADEAKGAREVNLEQDRVFRLRSEGSAWAVTAKRRTITPDGTEVNDEIEFAVLDVASFRAFAQYLGYRPFIVKRKRTRAYTLGRAVVELHRIDPIGDFIEVEVLVQDQAEVAEADAEIRAVLASAGVPASAIEPRLYIDLLRDAGAGRPDR